jgi:hypothetical protein
MATELTQAGALQEIANAIDNLVDNIDPNNAYGETVGDCLYNIGYQFSRIADSLEKIASK